MNWRYAHLRYFLFPFPTHVGNRNTEYSCGIFTSTLDEILPKKMDADVEKLTAGGWSTGTARQEIQSVVSWGLDTSILTVSPDSKLLRIINVARIATLIVPLKRKIWLYFTHAISSENQKEGSCWESINGRLSFHVGCIWMRIAQNCSSINWRWDSSCLR